jgi:GT2 family glycosyltransferase
LSTYFATALRDCLRKIVEGIQLHPNYGFYAPKILEFAHPERLYAAGLMFSNRGYGNRSQRFQLQDIDYPIELFGACGAAAVYRRETLSKVGLFNEDYFFLYEDLEISFRHQLHGFRCLYLPSAVVYHHGSVTLHKYFSLAVKEGVKNSLVTLITCTPTEMLIRYFYHIIIFYFRFCFHVLSKDYFKSFFSAIVFVISRLSSLIEKRRCLQSRSIIDLDYLEGILYRGYIYINFDDEVVRI